MSTNKKDSPNEKLLIGQLSRDLKNQLTFMGGYAQMLSEKFEGKPEARWSKEISKGCQQISEILRKFDTEYSS